MHEMGIANSILDSVHNELHRYREHRATKVGVRIGKLAGVDPESLRFCFDALVKDSEFERLELEIEWTAGDELDFAYLELEDAVKEATA